LQVQKIDSIRCRIGARWGAVFGFVFAAGTDDGGVEVADGLGEVAAGVVLVPNEGFAASELGGVAARSV
jgi:hypothetical protein